MTKAEIAQAGRDGVLLRRRYPDGLICVRCARLLATRPASDAKSTLTEAERQGYVCAECRIDREESGRQYAARVRNLEQARRARDENPPQAYYTGGLENGPPDASNSEGLQGGFSLLPDRDGAKWRRWGRQGGRPRRYETTQAAQRGAAERQRAYRGRHRYVAPALPSPAEVTPAQGRGKAVGR